MPAPRPRALWTPLVVGAAAVLVAAAALSPPGRALVSNVREAIGVDHAAPALFRLPAGGRVLVDSDAGSWVVHPDGSKRLLGGWRESSWSPGGRFVVATGRNELAALEADGDVRWKLARAGVRSPRWGGGRFDTRIAYLRRDELRVVAGDGTGDHRLAGGVRPVAPAWQPATFHFLAYATRGGRVVSRDADSGRTFWSTRVPDVTRLEWSGGDPLLLVQGRRSLTVLGPGGRVRYRLFGGPDAAPVPTARFSPSGRALAFVQRTAGRSFLWVVPRLAPDASVARRVFSGVGSFTDLEWSPDGRWLLVGWRDADQWVFIRSARVRRIEAVSEIRSQFDSTRFPRVSGWCCG